MNVKNDFFLLSTINEVLGTSVLILIKYMTYTYIIIILKIFAFAALGTLFSFLNTQFIPNIFSLFTRNVVRVIFNIQCSVVKLLI